MEVNPHTDRAGSGGGLAAARRSNFARPEIASDPVPHAVEFVRPGILFKITQGQIEADGTISATFSITDPQGLGLDMNGVTTPGQVQVGMTLASIYNDHISEQYVSHILETVT